MYTVLDTIDEAPRRVVGVAGPYGSNAYAEVKATADFGYMYTLDTGAGS